MEFDPVPTPFWLADCDCSVTCLELPNSGLLLTFASHFPRSTGQKGVESHNLHVVVRITTFSLVKGHVCDEFSNRGKCRRSNPSLTLENVKIRPAVQSSGSGSLVEVFELCWPIRRDRAASGSTLATLTGAARERTRATK